MTDFDDLSGNGSADSGLKPAASLTSIPVRRRRKTDGIIARPQAAPRPQPAPEPAETARPRKESFGKLRIPEDAQNAPAPNAAPADTPPQEPSVSISPRGTAQPPEGIIALWESLTGDNLLPTLIDLDMGKVAAGWPNSLLLRASGSPRRPSVEVARVFSADAAHDTAPLPIDTMTIDWMMALAREVTHDGVPVHELDNVSADDPSVEYGVIALPFGDATGAVDHVLCHLYRYDGPAAESAPAREHRERPASPKPGRRPFASIFGRRQSAAG